MPGSRILSKISRTKIIDSSDLRTDLKRCLTTTDLMLLGVGNMVGSGVYVLTGEVTKNIAGPSVLLSYIIAGFVALMSAICYAEFGARVPKTGSAFIYAYVTMGEIWAFIIGWNLILEYVVCASAVASAWSGSLNQLLGNEIKNATIEVILNGQKWDSDLLADYPDLIAFSLVCILLVVVCLGISCSSSVMNWLVFINVLIVLVIFILSLTKANISNFNSGNGFFAFSYSGVISGSATCFYAFVGFDAVALAAEEALTPAKSMPIASLFSVTFSTCLYVTASVALILMVPYYDIVPKAPFPAAFKKVGYEWAQYVVGTGTLIGMCATLLGSLVGLPRSVYAMASEGLLYPCFAFLSKRTQIPVISTFVFGGIAALLALLLDLSALVEFLSIGTLMAYTMVAAAVIIKRYEPVLNIAEKDDTTKNNDSNDNLLFSQSLLISGDNYKYGTLKDQFKNLKFISTFQPGKAVPLFYVISVFFQSLFVIAVSHTSCSTWWTLLLAMTFGVLAILTFIPIPLHKHNEDIITFKTPFIPYFPALSVFVNILLMAKLKPLTWIRFVVWVTLGLLIYACYGYHNSLEGRKRNSHTEGSGYQIMSVTSDEESSLLRSISVTTLETDTLDSNKN